MTDLTFTIFRYVFLALLWLLVYFVVRSLRKDIETFSPRKSFGHHMRDRKAQKAARKLPTQAASPTPAMGGGRASRGMHSAAPTLLTVLDGPAAGVSVPLAHSTITLGRSSSNAVVLDDEFASSHHARVYLDPVSRAWAVEDLNSTNGTVVNHHRITQPVALQAGVPVRIGSTTFELR
ncbi:FHA domain-containing protein [Bifidobacterium bombi]|uniref:FHA domain protein n=1 Tax=Bifidobacterium bombi DSM 19703 TaxID=1341695 RepID=A0A086BPA9_9BIFI|nr:FHA domain-containing protein [Bifidobacterium bombi]KFF31773.1 FHA domain protein [Bifidobacterium bombi DSM 19703]